MNNQTNTLTHTHTAKSVHLMQGHIHTGINSHLHMNSHINNIHTNSYIINTTKLQNKIIICTHYTVQDRPAIFVT